MQSSKLTDLSGKTHKQTSAICLYYKNELVWSYVEEALLTMHELDNSEITRYLELDKPLNSCGSYKYESLGCHLFSKVTGQSENYSRISNYSLTSTIKKK